MLTKKYVWTENNAAKLKCISSRVSCTLILSRWGLRTRLLNHCFMRWWRRRMYASQYCLEKEFWHCESRNPCTITHWKSILVYSSPVSISSHDYFRFHPVSLPSFLNFEKYEDKNMDRCSHWGHPSSLSLRPPDSHSRNSESERHANKSVVQMLRIREKCKQTNFAQWITKHLQRRDFLRIRGNYMHSGNISEKRTNEGGDLCARPAERGTGKSVSCK